MAKRLAVVLLYPCLSAAYVQWPLPLSPGLQYVDSPVQSSPESSTTSVSGWIWIHYRMSDRNYTVVWVELVGYSKEMFFL